MPVFAWPTSTGEPWRLVFDVLSRGSGASPDRDELARLQAARLGREDEERLKLARTRWLEDNKAERSFPCGNVPKPVGADLMNVPASDLAIIQVTAAVLPHDLVFLTDGDDDVEDVGRIPRPAIGGVDVVDAEGRHVPEPLQETFEAPDLSLMVLRWSNEGVDEEERFAFRSVWLAWKAARKLLDARQG
jgi:hypothetical protein